MRDNLIILGFDVGSKKTGVAIGQSLTANATALHKIPCHQGLPIDFKTIEALIATWRPHAIVVGMPLRPDGKSQLATAHAQAFMTLLQEKLSLPIYSIDELLTTKNARSELFDAGGYRHLQKSDVDSYAAKLIVESWLTEHAAACLSSLREN